jgi:hypothetical protein
MKRKTIDDLCKSEPGTFKKFIEKKEAHLKALENERKERVRASRAAVLELSWTS